MTKARKKIASNVVVGEALQIEELQGLASELQTVRHYPPITRRSDGKYEGDFLGFVKGLKLSARLIYILRDELSENTNLDVSWGHLLDDAGASFSPECDIIIHEKGFVRRWNGNKNPIMEFVFVKAAKALAVISCKSKLDTIDQKYTSQLKKYGVKNVLLFAESCPETRLPGLQRKAKNAGYKGLWCLYLTRKDESFLPVDGRLHLDFIKTIQKMAVSKTVPHAKAKARGIRPANQLKKRSHRR